MKDETEKMFEKIVALNMIEALKEFKQSPDFSLKGLMNLHNKTFSTSPKAPKEVNEMLSSYAKLRPARNDWSKKRFNVTPFPYPTFYSPLDKKSLDRTKKVIEQAMPTEMSGLSREEKVKRLADVYAHLDYTHMFWDGNSRINRLFVSELAKVNGIELDFGKVSQRDMYIARDKALADINIQLREKEELKSVRAYNNSNAYDAIVDYKQDLEKLYIETNLVTLFERCINIDLQHALEIKTKNKNNVAQSSPTRSCSFA